MIYETLYRKIAKLLPVEISSLRVGQAWKLQAEGFMDLHIDVLDKGTDDSGRKFVRISLAHYYKQNGDLMADPDMEVALYPEMRMAEALTFQMAAPPIYQEVYPEPGKVRPKLKKDLNSFLNQWLSNIRQQGHKLRKEALI